jgi:cytochrome o ubiquinol oxidase subunit 2
LTWLGTHILDPYRPISRIAPGQALVIGAKPLQVDVVALDWKWLFIYPDYGIATVNELAAPVDRPIEFRITSSSVMNSFYIPALAGQIYAMPGMETELHAVINKAGDFKGFSSNYSGAGFSGMHFTFHGLTAPDFDKWIDGIKKGGGTLTAADYLELEQPSENVVPRHYSSVNSGLYKSILNLCVKPGAMCMSDMMGADIKSALVPDQNRDEMKSMHIAHPAQKNDNEMKMDMDMPMSNPK